MRERDETRVDRLKGMPFFAIRIELEWYLDPLLFATWIHLVASERARLLGKPVSSRRLFTRLSTTDATIYILRTLIYVHTRDPGKNLLRCLSSVSTHSFQWPSSFKVTWRILLSDGRIQFWLGNSIWNHFLLIRSLYWWSVSLRYYDSFLKISQLRDRLKESDALNFNLIQLRTLYWRLSQMRTILTFTCSNCGRFELWTVPAADALDVYLFQLQRLWTLTWSNCAYFYLWFIPTADAFDFDLFQLQRLCTLTCPKFGQLVLLPVPTADDLNFDLFQLRTHWTFTCSNSKGVELWLDLTAHISTFDSFQLRTLLTLICSNCRGFVL